MQIVFPRRVADRMVGGNTTYTRQLEHGLQSRGIATGRIPCGPHAATTMVVETLDALRPRRDSVVHFTADTGPLLGVRAPSVVTVHGVASRWISVARTPTQEKVWRLRVARAISSTDRVITVSQSSARDITEIFGVSGDRLVVIPHGIDVPSFAAPAPLSAEVSRRLPGQYLLYVGNIEPRKNLEALVAALDHAPLAGSGLPLVVAGRPAWNHAGAMAAIAASRKVVHLGFVSNADRAALMQNCALFTFPSLYEGFGFPVLEALAAGAPVAASRRGSLQEVAGPSYALGALDAPALSHQLAAALDDAAWQARCRAQGRAWAGRFSWDRSVSGHIDTYREVATG